MQAGLFNQFQSTPPAWGATADGITATLVNVFQSTPPAWGATWLGWDWGRAHWFQSTPPAWGATRGGLAAAPTTLVSIHAPRVGGDDGGSNCRRG